MRILSTLLGKNARPIPQEPIPFQEILPLKLKPVVSGKGGKNSEVCCIYEMSVMFACFQEHEFKQKPCNKEIDAFQKCYFKHLTDKKQRVDREAKGILTPGDKNLTAKQLNLLLRKYPNV